MMNIRTGLAWLSITASLGAPAWADSPPEGPQSVEATQQLQALYDTAISQMVAQDMEEATASLNAILALEPGPEWESRVQARLADIDRFQLWTQGESPQDAEGTSHSEGSHSERSPMPSGSGRFELSLMGGFTGLHGFFGGDEDYIGLVAFPFAGVLNAPLRGSYWFKDDLALQIALGTRNEGRLEDGIGSYDSWGVSRYQSLGLQYAPHSLQLPVTPFVGLSLGALFVRDGSKGTYTPFAALETGARITLSEHVTLRAQAAVKPLFGEDYKDIYMSEIGIGLSLFL